MAANPPKKDAAEGDAHAGPKKSGSKMVIIIVALVALLGGGGGAYWFMSRDKGEDTAKEESVKPPQFLPLEAFTVNLVLEDNPQFLQVILTLKLVDAASIDVLKPFMPEIRDRILLLLSAQKASVLLTLEGKQKLAADIVGSVNAIVAPLPAKTAKSAKAKKKAKGEEEEEVVEDEEATDAEDEDDAPKKKAAAKKKGGKKSGVAAGPVLSVLFTSFIIQ